MRSKIRCDKKSYKILEFWMQLNKSEVSPGVMDVLADGTAKPAPRTAPCRKKATLRKKAQTHRRISPTKPSAGGGRIYRSPDSVIIPDDWRLARVRGHCA